MASPVARAISRDMAEVLVEADGGRAVGIGKCSGCKVVTACYWAYLPSR
jgi:hypothetical protein